MKTMETTLLVLVKDGKILLSRKKRGFGEGILNGVGGKIEAGETPAEAMIREAREEIGIELGQVKPVGVIFFDEVVKGERGAVKMNLFLSSDYSGKILESDEIGDSKWFSVNEIPYDKMFKDDLYWLPLVLAGKCVEGNFVYDDDFNLLDASVIETGEIDA